VWHAPVRARGGLNLTALKWSFSLCGYLGDARRFDFFGAYAGPDREAAEELADLLQERSALFPDCRMLRVEEPE